MPPLQSAFHDEIISSSLIPNYDLEDVDKKSKGRNASMIDIRNAKTVLTSLSTCLDFPSIEWYNVDDDCENDSSCDSLSSSLESTALGKDQGLKRSHKHSEDLPALLTEENFDLKHIEDESSCILRGAASAALAISNDEATIGEPSWGHFIELEECQHECDFGSMKQRHKYRTISKKQKRWNMASPYEKKGSKSLSADFKSHVSLRL
eukprot:CAMPEP_0194366462 /NCGR_PEP_ID=MMETSP0174-20130528/14507_1 /TAXON_ID=216777 /ORGANISM="Proboscia alata, Strain PI-D3" /LENGTH=206 /DNA_ID=CAMNT_0039141661 /DNA_START=35 /DNA_END=655 /DNA_ORIENTATION=-